MAANHKKRRNRGGYNSKDRGKDKRPYQKDRNPGNDETNRDGDKMGYDAARNDISWYTRYPNLSIASAQFPFPYRPGMKVPLGGNLGDGRIFDLPYRIPGVLTLEWFPSVGWSEGPTDPASIVCKELYAKVRKSYGAGELLADAPDFMIYLMALDSIFSYIASLRRVYRILTAWSPNNYVMPDTLLGALGVNESSAIELRTHRTELWQVINELTLMSRKFTCPAVMDIMNRHFWMNDNVYTDENSINSQMYVFRQRGFYQFAMLPMPNGDNAGGLKMVAAPFGNFAELTVNSLFTFGRTLIDALVSSDDAYTINGYLARAFDGTPNFVVDETPLDQPFNPVYEPEVLMQIENSRAVWAGDVVMSNLNVTQDVLTNSIIHNPYVVGYTSAADNPGTQVGKFGLNELNAYLSIRSDTPSVADNLIASRLHTGAKKWKTVSDVQWYRIVSGTEILVDFSFRYGTQPTDAYAIPSVMGAYDGSLTAANVSTLVGMFALEAFDWHPFTLLAVFSGTTGATLKSVAMCGDTHNITAFTQDDLANMHKMCVYSEFSAFSVG